MAAGLIVCVPLHYLSVWTTGRSPWPRRFLGWVARRAGMRPRIAGKPVMRNVLILANHSSWLDIMLIAGATGATFVSRDDVNDWPVAGWLSRLNHTIFVSRSAKSSVIEQAEALRRGLLTGQPVALFPEGTTDGGTQVLPFRASLLAAVSPPPEGIMVQPVAIDFGEAGPDVAWVGKEPALQNVRRILSRRGTTPVTLRFLDPIDPGAIGDRKTLAATGREAIVAALGASAQKTDHL